MIEKPERFEPERAKEIREAMREAFAGDEKLRLADVVFERGPEIPEGEVGVVLQTLKKVNGTYLLLGEYLDLPDVEHRLDTGRLAEELDRVRSESLDMLATQEEGVRLDPEEWAMQELERMRNPGKRNRMGSTMVGDREALSRRNEARKTNEGDSPMGPSEFVRLSGWVTYRDVEVFEKWKREAENDSIRYFTGDKGIRYVHPGTGIHCTLQEALGGQLIRDARDVGGFRSYKKLIDENRIE
jgi:hypothetical protein